MRTLTPRNVPPQAVLPFTTGLMAMSDSQLQLGGLVKVVVGVPMMIGYLSLSILCCYPFVCMLDEPEGLDYWDDFDDPHWSRYCWENGLNYSSSTRRGRR